MTEIQLFLLSSQVDADEKSSESGLKFLSSYVAGQFQHIFDGVGRLVAKVTLTHCL